MNERTKRYEDAGISRDRYMELKFIARQYDAMRRAEERIQRGEYDRKPSKNGKWRQSDPTGNEAVSRIERSFAPRIRAIEEAAKEAGADLWRFVLRSVARGETYERMGPPCGRRQFYQMRRRFFIELDSRV